MNIRNLLVGANLPESLEMLREAAVAKDRFRSDCIAEFICEYYHE
jgi:hypothetical protein